MGCFEAHFEIRPNAAGLMTFAANRLRHSKKLGNEPIEK
jgi:hypothetical protein